DRTLGEDAFYRGVPEGLVHPRGDQEDVGLSEEGPDLGVESREVDLEVAVGSLLTQLLLVPFVSGERGPEQCHLDLASAPLEEIGGLENEVHALAGGEAAHVQQPQRTFEGLARRGRMRWRCYAVVDDLGASNQCWEGPPDGLLAEPAVDQHALGCQVGEVEESVDPAVAGPLGLMDVTDRPGAAKPGQKGPLRNDDGRDVDGRRTSSAEHPPG